MSDLHTQLRDAKSALDRERKHVRVGVAVILRRGNSILMGQRKGSHGAGTWSFPGGHLEIGETVADCAVREVREETGLEIVRSSVRKLTFTNDVFEAEGKHYVTLYVEAAWPGGEARVLEPDKCAEWSWVESPPEPLFLPVRNLLAEGLWRR
ncbi:MAG TPA: NUDIX hydrolase [Thermoanaerobaculia bacterium]|jgi:8-oxo-dGTP diphosphatase|nr:NUDIX hydrolase [Thermoanaerobaculia bacterium]